ncbi:hypothetical protein TVAG_044170 [Trichomonas vaginalis G3]|uniref:Tubby C-terminal domain-containing protein n=1 Tax=Trichomonas vaginalis (strain ATCC PRA-98 / G3) TaxID=412133 RepID=A2E0H7_TRIV3|nr:hypothetical protein TVAGG3_0550130 [Trichomonas vaginalis G3]EAY13857.1 hypothetical protein TVAG_044170 [Trichomonas vaginalis G3]KAI5520441.1 hypothetical protein TVAGG3_0550130 [Trichomonas vaginalis G3]|eukprot:XP_001326080.1 hypothetical protein [Trichomonas vaginalis G3]
MSDTKPSNDRRVRKRLKREPSSNNNDAQTDSPSKNSVFILSNDDDDSGVDSETPKVQVHTMTQSKSETPMVNPHANSALEIPRLQNMPQESKPQLRLLDRYKSSTPRASSRLQLIPIWERVNHYTVHREKVWQGGTFHKLFTMKQVGDNSGSFVAQAKYASTFSQEIKVSNPRGLICEIDTNNEGLFNMRLGNDISLSLKIEAGHAVHAEFFEIDGVIPPYKKLTSPPGICSDLKSAFGDRKAIPSIKNCKMCFNGEEIIAVRKVAKDDVEIDAKGTISFLACFSIALFMFVQS